MFVEKVIFLSNIHDAYIITIKQLHYYYSGTSVIISHNISIIPGCVQSISIRITGVSLFIEQNKQNNRLLCLFFRRLCDAIYFDYKHVTRHSLIWRRGDFIQNWCVPKSRACSACVVWFGGEDFILCSTCDDDQFQCHYWERKRSTYRLLIIPRPAWCQHRIRPSSVSLVFCVPCSFVASLRSLLKCKSACFHNLNDINIIKWIFILFHIWFCCRINMIYKLGRKKENA